MSDNAPSPAVPAATNYPPAMILFIVALCVLVGVSAAAEVIESWIGGRFFHFDFGVFALPIAFGLLARKHSSRRWALFFAGFGLIGSCAVFAFALASRASGPGLGWTLFYTGAAAALGLGCIVMLRSAGGRAWFSGTQSPVPNRWLILFPIIVSTAIAIFDGTVTKRSLTQERQTLVDSAFFVDCRFDFFDAKTGNPIPAGFGFTSGSGMQDDEPAPAPKLSYSPQNGSFVVRGLAFAPYTLQAVADGYQPADYTITEHTADAVKICLQPVATP